jgi:ketosteroid isomerase-like protein
VSVEAFGQAEAISKAEKDAINDISIQIKKAIDAKDSKALEQLYSVDFVHIHAIGKINDRSARIAALVSGEPTVDSKGVEGFNLRKFGNAIIATGKIAMINDEGDPVVYSVTRVFARSGNRWLLVSSHASQVEQ